MLASLTNRYIVASADNTATKRDYLSEMRECKALRLLAGSCHSLSTAVAVDVMLRFTMMTPTVSMPVGGRKVLEW